MAAIRTIKKYPNRRLYDTEISSYITLEDVRQLILDAVDFRVVDAKRGHDITRSVMLQIIAEYEERGDPLFSTEMLSQLIRFYGDAMQGIMGRYLERSLSVFMDQQEQFRSQLNDLVGQAPVGLMQEMIDREAAGAEESKSRKGQPRLHAVGGRGEEGSQ